MWPVHLIRGVFHLDISFTFWFWVLIAEVDGVGDKVRTYHNSWCTDNLDSLFEHVPQICVCNLWRFILVKSKISGLGNALLECQIITISELSDGLKEVCCTYDVLSIIIGKLLYANGILCFTQISLEGIGLSLAAVYCSQRQPNLPLSIRINTGSLYRNVSMLNYKRDKDNVS